MLSVTWAAFSAAGEGQVCGAGGGGLFGVRWRLCPGEGGLRVGDVLKWSVIGGLGQPRVGRTLESEYKGAYVRGSSFSPLRPLCGRSASPTDVVGSKRLLLRPPSSWLKLQSSPLPMTPLTAPPTLDGMAMTTTSSPS